MKPYKNQSGNSGILSYESGKDWVKVEFAQHGLYLYDAKKPGLHHVQKMNELAAAGKGLSTYISRHVRENYSKKLR